MFCCITIRTALLKNGQAYIQAGGGWVNDSSPEAEYQETVNKAKAMLKANWNIARSEVCCSRCDGNPMRQIAAGADGLDY
jgi:anthranilate/para-aminobenzoate synthase component I